MTTNVTIKTVSWPVEVSPVRSDDVTQPDGAAQTIVIPPNTEYTVSLWQERALVLKELPQP